MSKIIIENLSIRFRAYNRHQSLKEFFANFLHRRPQARAAEFRALDDVSLNITAGERVGIVGHNGAGKSTFLKALCRVYEPTKGRVRVEGRLAPLLEIGAGFHPEFTGRENIYFNGAILGYTPQQLHAIESEIVAFAELEQFIDMPVKYYSTGMYLRLAFSLATACEPDILVLDEMFAGGDVAFVQRATDRMKRMIDRANIMILVSHNLDLLASMCERVIWLDHGRIRRDGPTVQVLTEFVASMSPAAKAA